MKLRFRLWHLFALTLAVGAVIACFQHLGFRLHYEPQSERTAKHFYFDLDWNGEELFYYDSWPPPDPPGYDGPA